MSTASTTAHNVRDTAKDVLREGVREIGEDTSAASADIQIALQMLRDDFGRLADQIGDIVAGKGSAAWRRTKSSVDGVVSDARGKGREEVESAHDVSDNFVDAIDELIKKHPYTTLALIASLGFMFGATWRR